MSEERQDRRPERKEPSPEVDRLAQQVIGALIEVHRHLGPGHLESTYEEALCVELGLQAIPFSRQHPAWVDYKGHRVGESRLDLLVGGQLIVELKAVDALAPIHKAQVISYLRITGLELALLVNLNVPKLRDGIKRIVLT